MKIKHILTKTTVNEGVLDDVRARMDARRNPAATTAQPAAPAAPVANQSPKFKVGDTVSFGIGRGVPSTGTITAMGPGPTQLTVKTAEGENKLDTRMKSLYLQLVPAAGQEPAVTEASAEFDPSQIDPNEKCKTCGTAFKNHFRFDDNGKITGTLVRHMTMKDDFPGMPGRDASAFFGTKPGMSPRPTSGTSNLARPNPTPDLPRATKISQNKTTGETVISYNGKLFALPDSPYAKAPEGVTGERVLVPAAAFGIRSMGDVIAVLGNDSKAYAEQPMKVFNTYSTTKSQGLDEADEWEEDTDKHRRFIDYAKKILMRERDPKRRIESANYLSKQENKFFGSPISSSTEDMPFGSVNTGKAFTDLIKGIMTDIESGRLHYEQQALSAAIWLEPEGKAFLKKAYNDFVKMADYSRREREQHAIALSGYQIANLGGRVVGSLKGGIVNDPTASMTPEILGVHELAEKEIQRINGEKEDEAERQRNIAMWNALPMPLKIAAAAAVGKTPAQMEKIILAKDEIEAIAALSPSDFPNLRQQATADDEDDFDDMKKPMAEIKESQSAELKSLLKSAGISQNK